MVPTSPPQRWEWRPTVVHVGIRWAVAFPIIAYMDIMVVSIIASATQRPVVAEVAPNATVPTQEAEASAATRTVDWTCAFVARIVNATLPRFIQSRRRVPAWIRHPPGCPGGLGHSYHMRVGALTISSEERRDVAVVDNFFTFSKRFRLVARFV